MDKGSSVRETFCRDCESYAHCRNACLKLQREIKQPGAFYEKVDYENDRIIMFKHGPEQNTTAFDENDRPLEQYSTEEALQLNTDAFELTQSQIFFEVFFNRRTYEDVADCLGIPVAHVIRYYNEACKRIEQVAAAMDRRNSGLKKATAHKQLTEQQKAFLLVYIYGFSFAECARIFGKNKKTIQVKARYLFDKYMHAFAEAE